MSKSIIPKMVEDIIEELKEVAQRDYSIDDIVNTYEALEQITNILDELTNRERPAYIEPEKPKLRQPRPRGGRGINLWKSL